MIENKLLIETFISFLYFKLKAQLKNYSIQNYTLNKVQTLKKKFFYSIFILQKNIFFNNFNNIV